MKHCLGPGNVEIPLKYETLSFNQMSMCELKANQSVGNTGLLGLSSMGSAPALPSNVPGGGGGSGSGSSSVPQLTLPLCQTQ